MQKRHRIFIAISLPEDVKRGLAKEQEVLSRDFGEEMASWTNKENIHITLVFLGDLTDQEIADVCSIANEVAKAHKPFTINLDRISYGPNNLKENQIPRMIWAMGEASKELQELKNDLQESLLEKVRFRPDEFTHQNARSAFVGHITLARLKEWQFKQINPDERPDVEKNIDFIFTVETIDVMESVLKRKGPEYTILESCELKNEN